jgi:hypothetical protein
LSDDVLAAIEGSFQSGTRGKAFVKFAFANVLPVRTGTPHLSIYLQARLPEDIADRFLEMGAAGNEIGIAVGTINKSLKRVRTSRYNSALL